MNDVLPSYISPCVSETVPKVSLESFWLYSSDFGECYNRTQEASQLYPRLVPVYNGKVLDIDTEFVHASLSGISIKHYYGKCMKDPEEDEDSDEDVLYGDGTTEGYDYDWFDEEVETSMSPKNATKAGADTTESTSGSFEYRESVCLEGQPLCTIPKINHRNSFWDIHRPELCKLTWGQKYVGKSTVTEHLHEHLVQHGALCVGFHTPEDREFMLDRELDEYGRLKILEESRKLPPDEPLFDFREPEKTPKVWNPKCKMATMTTAISHNDRFLKVEDDEDEPTLRRSKEEFCLTIGRHIRRPPITEEESLVPEESVTHPLPYGGEEEEEGSAIFYYNWLLYTEEEPYEDESDRRFESVSISISEPEPLVPPCPPLMMDEFCRAAGKVDFSDLRCDPDF